MRPSRHPFFRPVRRIVVYALCLALAMACLPALAGADERILLFDSDIVIHPDSSMTVTETITVRAEGLQIKRGIYRDFPTTYRTSSGRTVRVGFDVLQVLKDGRPEPYFIKSQGNGQRIYIGDKDVYLPNGVYTYAITYATTRQLGFFDDYDELYWNVTGLDWAFPMDQVRATVHLPKGAEPLQMAGYTGSYGASGRDFEGFVGNGGEVVFTTTRTMYPREGLTIAVAWPKGFVEEPPMDLLQPLFIALVAFILILGYYILAWLKVGKDPAKGTIIPLFDPPRHFSPAALRYVNRMGFDKRCVACAVIDMAVKGFLSISKGTTYYKLTRTKDAETRLPLLTKGEKELAKHFFATKDELVLKNKNHARIRKGIDAFKKYLKLEFEVAHFKTNSLWLVPGAIMTLAAMITIAACANESGEAFGVVFMGTFWSIPVAVLGTIAFKKLFGSGTRGTGIFLSLFLLPFLAVEIFLLFMLAVTIGFGAMLILGLIIATNVAFYHWLKAPTFTGRRIMDQIDGFRMYLETAEQERYKELQPPDRTLELFERYLPYALALDVEHAWSEQFADILAHAGQDGGSYSPMWYRSRNFDALSTAAFASALAASMTQAVASSATAPGSSSGSGGGGFSGGGGGGGGGGGW